MDATDKNHCTILVIEPSSIEKDMLWRKDRNDDAVHINSRTVEVLGLKK